MSCRNGNPRPRRQENAMRLIFGMILGAILTVVGAYVHDTVWIGPPATTTGTEQRPMVNWDVVSSTARNAGKSAREQVDKLTK
jgi:hypothetical protein